MAAINDVRAIALALPDAVEADHHGFPSFRVGGKIFATLRTDLPQLMVKLDAEDQTNFVGAYPGIVVAVPGYWGRKGSTFVAAAAAEASLVETLLGLAWRRAAPSRLTRG